MKLKLNKEIKIKAWLNEQMIADENWTIYSEDQGDTLYIFIKDPNSTNQVKLRIEKSSEIEESPTQN
jgi:hypothetical protein